MDEFNHTSVFVLMHGTKGRTRSWWFTVWNDGRCGWYYWGLDDADIETVLGSQFVAHNLHRKLFKTR
jgi:hypothetical protein